MTQQMEAMAPGNDMEEESRKMQITERGFTLVELVITLLLAGMISLAVYTAYRLQVRTYETQSQVVEMQQNAKVGVDFLTRELRLAGYDPLGTAGAGITTATPTAVAFSADLDEDGALNNTGAGVEEFVAFELDGGALSLNRDTSLAGPVVVGGGGGQPVAEQIERIEFQYLFEDGTAATTNVTNALDLAKIRAIRISLLARVRRADTKYINDQTYTTAAGTVWDPNPDDNFRRRLIISQVDLRNMGL
jgi:type IV pilus assembly protein PilW